MMMMSAPAAPAGGPHHVPLAEIPAQLHQQQLDHAIHYSQSWETNFERVEAAAKAQTDAIGTLTTTLQINLEKSENAAAAALQNTVKPTETTDDAASTVVEDAAEMKMEDAASEQQRYLEELQSADRQTQMLEMMAKENATLKEQLKYMQQMTVPAAEVASLRAKLELTEELHRKSTEEMTSLSQALEANLTHVSEQATAEVTEALAEAAEKSANAGVGSNGSGWIPSRHPAWEKVVREIESTLDKNAKHADNAIELKRLRAELEPLRGEKNDLVVALNNAKSDAQCATYQNGVLVQQLASLLQQHNEGGINDLPVTRADLAAFGGYQLPATDELMGVPFATPNGPSAIQTVNLENFSVRNVQELVERCSQLTAQLWKSANGGATHPTNGRAIKGRSTLDTSRPLPAIGRRRNRDEAAAADEEELRPAGGIRAAGMKLGDDEAEGPKKDTAEVGIQSDALDALHHDLQTARSRFFTIECASAMPFSHTDALGAESLVSASMVNASAIAKADSEAFESVMDLNTVLKSALEESGQLVLQLETRNDELENELDVERCLSAELQLKLSLEASKALHESHLPLTVEQHLTQPLKLLDDLQSALGDAAPGKMGQRAAELDLSESIARLATISSSLKQQEDTMCSVLRLSNANLTDAGTAPGNGEALSDIATNSGGSSTKANIVLREEVHRLRQLVTAEQAKLRRSQDDVDAERKKHVEMLERIWSADEESAELRRQHEADVEQMTLTVPAAKHEALATQLADMQSAKDVLELEAAKTTSDLQSTIQQQTAELTQQKSLNQQLQSQHEEMTVQLGKASSELQNTTARKAHVECELTQARSDLKEMSENVHQLKEHISSQQATIGGLEADLKDTKCHLLAQQCTREHVIAMFPDDSAIVLALNRLSELDTALNAKVEDSARTQTLCDTLQKQYDLVSREKAELHHQFVLHQSQSVVSTEEARHRVQAAEDAASAAQFQLSAATSDLQAKEAQLQAALQREAIADERIKVLSLDPISANVRKYGVRFTNDITAQMDDLHDAKKAVEADLATSKQQVATLFTQGQELTATVAKLEAKIAQQVAAHAAVASTLERTNEKLQNTEAAKAETEAECEAAKTAVTSNLECLQAFKDENEDLTEQLQKFEELLSAESAALAEERAAKAVVEGAAKELTDILGQKQLQLAQHEGHLAELESKVERLTDDNQKLKSSCECLQQSLVIINSNRGGGGGGAGGHRGQPTGAIMGSFRHR